ncbi:hypothetical protein PFLUV_G00023120 [Perca fluviatilis]|uniref:Uncharacterized protein n=1 Tax=Perca fluviatilis TaxID=8168 RepID=A0A6A5FRA0_PERFL|nr:hypothetical protein PFLUV_G00023120 [Perca fluviatilis]
MAAPEQQMKQDWSTTLIPTTEAFWREKKNDRKTYPADKNSIRNRVALLITNIKFTEIKPEMELRRRRTWRNCSGLWDTRW